MANPAYYQSSIVSQEVKQKEHLLHLYLYQDWNTQRTTVNPSLAFQFGENVVFDWPVYDDIRPKGKLVARAQGLQIGAAIAERRWFFSFNLVFTDQRFKGSGLKVEGTWQIETPDLEWAVVGGTGEFVRAQGTAAYKSSLQSNLGLWDLHFHFACPILTEPTNPITPPIKVEPPMGGNGGKAVDVTGKPQRVESVTIRSGDVIDSLSFTYTDEAGNKRTDGPWGTNGGVPVTIDLKPTETVKKIMGTTGNFGGNVVVNSLKIVTNLNTYGPYGKENGTQFAIPEKDSSSVVGFHGRAGLFLDAIGIYATEN